MSGALNVVLLQQVASVNKVITLRAMPMTPIDVAVEVVAGKAIRSTPATAPMSRAIVLVLLESST